MKDAIIKASMVDDALHIQVIVPIPSTTCPVCKRIYKHEVDLSQVENTLRTHYDVAGAITLPGKWQSVWNGKSYPEYRVIYVCPTCAEPINKAKAEGEAAECAAREIVRAAVTEWPER